MLSLEALGFIGGALVTGSLIPQVHRVFKRRSAYDISLPFTILLLIGMIFWLSYGLSFDLAPVILWNVISIVLVVALLYAKLKYGR